MNRVEKITGKSVPRITVDVCDRAAVFNLFKNNQFFAVLHLAALKAVGESVTKPLDYYRNNVLGTLNVLDVRLKRCSCFGVLNN